MKLATLGNRRRPGRAGHIKLKKSGTRLNLSDSRGNRAELVKVARVAKPESKGLRAVE